MMNKKHRNMMLAFLLTASLFALPGLFAAGGQQGAGGGVN
jgi:hypothetical protein